MAMPHGDEYFWDKTNSQSKSRVYRTNKLERESRMLSLMRPELEADRNISKKIITDIINFLIFPVKKLEEMS